MKKKAIILKILFATFISSTLLASTGAKMEGNAKPDTTKIKVQKGAGGNIYDLIYFTDSISRLKIALLDEEGKTLHHDVLNINSPFMRPYNLENLPSGNYTFVIIDNGTKMEKQFGHKNKAASQNITVGLENYNDGKSYKLIVTGAEPSPVYVKIFDLYEQLVYSDYINVEKAFSKVYDLSKVPSRQYRFEVHSQNQVISKNTF